MPQASRTTVSALLPEHYRRVEYSNGHVVPLTAVVPAVTLTGAYTAQERQELQLGQQVYGQLDRQGKILHESPYYAVLDPLGTRIAASADKQPTHLRCPGATST
ncbi:MAG TPA: hypothetical protein VFN37_00250 [Candidatus Baltobacteraceae bacterium]|nr:hypothetical protein [Candidatus Baltobacteraceae bacterium]